MLPDFRIRQRDYLLRISRAITEELDLDRVLAEIIRFSAEILGGSAGIIALRDAEGDWRVASTFGINPDFVQYLDPLIADIPDHGDPAGFELPEINRRLQRITQAASMGLLTGVGLPMTVKGEIVGVIFVFRSYRGQFSADDRKLLSAFASQAAIAVHNAMLFTEIAQQHHHLDAILESAADGIFILDPSYRFIRFNRACSSLMGYEADNVIGKKHKEIIRWLNREPGASLEDAETDGWLLGAQATLYVEGDLITKGGGAVSVGITYAHALDNVGEPLSIVATVRDITKFREAEELKSTFISIISHELRTPVALIKGYVGTLRREDARWDSEVVKDSLAVIEEEADHLSGMIDDLLDASRLQAGALKLNRSQIALDLLARQMADRFKTQSDRHDIEIDFPSDLPLVFADEARLMQVMGNLLSNAVKYSPDGGKVTISGSTKRNEIVVCV